MHLKMKQLYSSSAHQEGLTAGAHSCISQTCIPCPSRQTPSSLNCLKFTHHLCGSLALRNWSFDPQQKNLRALHLFLAQSSTLPHKNSALIPKTRGKRHSWSTDGEEDQSTHASPQQSDAEPLFCLSRASSTKREAASLQQDSQSKKGFPGLCWVFGGYFVCWFDVVGFWCCLKKMKCF